MKTDSNRALARAELGFKKSQRSAAVRARPMVEYLAESEKRRAHSAKLKALRLTKEAEDLAAADALPPKKRPSRKAPKK